MSLIGRCKSWTALKMGHCNKGRCSSTMYNTHKKAKLKAGFLSFISLHSRLFGSENKTCYCSCPYYNFLRPIEVKSSRELISSVSIFISLSCLNSRENWTMWDPKQKWDTRDLIKKRDFQNLHYVNCRSTFKKTGSPPKRLKKTCLKIRETLLALYLQLLETHTLAL